MTHDKQLSGITIQAVRQKRDVDQALNIKEFAVLAGISYSVAREWFRLPGFPQVLGKVFWGDFVVWRRTRHCAGVARDLNSSASPQTDQAGSKPLLNHSVHQWPARAAKILAG
jgi:hypothetical protein